MNYITLVAKFSAKLSSQAKKEKQPSPAVVCRMDGLDFPLKNEAVSQNNCNVWLPDRKTLSELDKKQKN